MCILLSVILAISSSSSASSLESGRREPFITRYNCIQLFSNDAAFNYLLRKKSCTKFYFVWSASSIKKQTEFISELKNVNIVISNGPRENWDVPLKNRLFLVNDYLKINYKSQKINKWDLLVLK